LNISWGTGSKKLAIALSKLHDEEQFLDLERSQGNNYYDSERKEQLAIYLRDFIGARQQNLPINPWLRAVSAPPQRNTFLPKDRYKGESPIVKITIYQLLSFFDGQNYQEVRNTPVMTIDIPKAEDA
jgi:hypothetical protein